MKQFVLAIFALIHFTSASGATECATPARQQSEPYSFALTAESIRFHELLQSRAAAEREGLVQLVGRDSTLLRAIRSYPSLAVSQRKDVLAQVFQHEVRALHMSPPKLFLEASPQGTSAFFDFDPRSKNPGAVYIDPAADLKGFSSLLLLIHETRHSAQLQFAQRHGRNDPVAFGFLNAFVTQRRIFDRHEAITACDFYLLLNEYEAFQFGNYVATRLLGDLVSNAQMGTRASQYDPPNRARFDLLSFMKSTPVVNWFEKFNQAQFIQKGVSSR